MLTTLLTACSLSDNAVDKVKDVNNKAHDVALAQLCKGYPLNIAPERYREDEDLLLAWLNICEVYYEDKE